MNEIHKRIFIKFTLWVICGFIICIVGISNVFAVSVTDYATKYYYYSANDNSSTTSTDYRTGSNNKVTLDGATAPTYDNGEGFNGFYNRINYSLTKGSIYTLSLTVNYNGVLSSEFSQSTINNRLLNTDFAHCSACTVTAVSGNIREYNSTNPAISGAKDYVVQMSYTFVATSSESQFYIGSYTGDDRTFGLDNHQSTVVVIVASLDISNDNSSTIINQNDTIINQNNQIIEQNNQNTQQIIEQNNQNTQSIIDSNKVCKLYDKVSIIDYKYLNVNGDFVSSSNWGVTDYISISSSATIEKVNNNGNAPSICFYNFNKSLISCSTNGSTPVGNVTIPSNSSFVRFSINSDFNSPQYRICNSGSQALDDSINNLNDSLTDSSPVSMDGLADTAGWLPAGPIDSIINLPLNLFNSLVTALNGTCAPLHIEIPYLTGKYIDIPCISTIFNQIDGLPGFWSWVGAITSVVILYRYLLALYKYYDDLTTLKANFISDFGGAP